MPLYLVQNWPIYEIHIFSKWNLKYLDIKYSLKTQYFYLIFSLPVWYSPSKTTHFLLWPKTHVWPIDQYQLFDWHWEPNICSQWNLWDLDNLWCDSIWFRWLEMPCLDLEFLRKAFPLSWFRCSRCQPCKILIFIVTKVNTIELNTLIWLNYSYNT